MPRPCVDVTYKPADMSRVPDEFTEGATLLVDLEQRGWLDVIGQRLHIRHQGGYCGLDVFLLLLLFFAAGAQ